MKFYLAIMLLAAMLFAPLAQATEIQQFDRMAGDDQINFVNKLVDSVEAASKSDPALLARVKKFFMAKQPREDISGMGRFELNLSLARIADMDAAAKNPKARRLEMEEVMCVTLEKSGIPLPSTFRPVAVIFQPQKPPGRALTRKDADKALAQTRAWIARTVEPEHTFSHGGPEGLSGFTNDQKAIAFFVGLATLAVLAGGGTSGSVSSSTSTPSATGGTTTPAPRPRTCVQVPDAIGSSTPNGRAASMGGSMGSSHQECN